DRYRHRAYPLPRRGAGRDRPARRRRRDVAPQSQQHRRAREDREGENSRGRGREASGAASGFTDDRRGRRAGFLDHRLVRAVRAGEYGPGSGGEDSRRRRQGFGIAAIARVLPREQLRARRSHARAIFQAHPGRFGALGRIGQSGRSKTRLKIGKTALERRITIMPEQYPPIRRFVTGHDANNVAKVLVQGAATNAKYPSPGTVSTLIWSTDRTPADIAVGEQIEDLGARIIGTAPAANGTRFAVIDFPPGNQPRMHRTETIDYVIVLEGEIEMDMDDSTVKMKAGDVMVQRGTNHAWANRSDRRARVAFVLVDAVPLGIGPPSPGRRTRADGERGPLLGRHIVRRRHESPDHWGDGRDRRGSEPQVRPRRTPPHHLRPPSRRMAHSRHP